MDFNVRTDCRLEHLLEFSVELQGDRLLRHVVKGHGRDVAWVWEVACRACTAGRKCELPTPMTPDTVPRSQVSVCMCQSRRACCVLTVSENRSE